MATYCKLEIVLHSGKSLTNVKHMGRQDPYVVVWISGRSKETKPLQTKVAKKGGCSPVWNHSMEFNISSQNRNYTLFCVIKHDGHMSDREIGQVQVPFTDLLAGGASGNNVSYPVRISSGEVKGELILSHKFSHPKIDDKDGFTKLDDLPKMKDGQKDGRMKRMVKKVGTQVASKVVILAGTAGLMALMVDDDSSGSAPAADATAPPADATSPAADATAPPADATAPPADATDPAAADAEVKDEDQGQEQEEEEDEDEEEDEYDDDGDDYDDF